MVVAVNLTRFLSTGNNEHFTRFFSALAADHPDHQFIFITDNKEVLPFNLSTNIVLVISRPKINQVFAWKLWYHYTLPALLKKYGAIFLINTVGVCTLRKNIRQCVFINEFYLDEKLSGDRKQTKFFRKNARTFLALNQFIFAGTRLQLAALAKRYKINEEKLHAVSIGINKNYCPAGFEEKDATKEKYTQGKEYFLFKGDLENNEPHLVNLLKGFSFFKKRQKSNMQLLLLSTGIGSPASLTSLLKTYKYRDEIKLLAGLPEEEIIQIMGAAYAFVYPLPEENFPVHPVEALQCQLPLFLTASPVFKDTAGEAALYIDNGNFMDIANNMMLLFKDETRRSELIRESLPAKNLLSTEQGKEMFWQLILRAAGQS
jgi:glycosyltransferase involved in cell wall biosynthesis